MPKLSQTTKDDLNPKNKAKIFICSHPEDHKGWFDSIAEDVWSLSDYPLHYDSAPTVREDSFFSDLEEMRLCIVIVTRRFLTEHSYAIDEILPYFKKKNIPILPIITEYDLDALFEEKMGDLHYIFRGEAGPTITPYKEKLAKYFSLVFSGEEMVARIQRAFDAYIFLSYRKTDRQFAQRLMRMIHANDSCVDIAIWYDEFLTPGESFNDAIAEAIGSSKLFAMAITPNIVSKGNYVMEKEYPIAKQSGKAIFPVEFLPTSEHDLRESFAGIPRCVPSSDESSFNKSLIEITKSFAIKKNDNDPVHNFLIGLAYLDGIDVEVDHGRAVDLITSAAKAGLVEAMDKLVNMYCVGHGVGVDYNKATEWQTKVINFFDKRYNIGEDKTNAAAGPGYINALIKQAEIYESLSQYKLALPFFQKARKVADHITEENKKYEGLLSDVTLKLAKTHLKLGNIVRASACILENFAYTKSPEGETDEEFTVRFLRQLLEYLLMFGEMDGELASDTKNGKAQDVLAIADSIYSKTKDEYDLMLYLKALIFTARTRYKEKRIGESDELSYKALELLSVYSEDRMPEEMRILKCQALSRLISNRKTRAEERKIS